MAGAPGVRSAAGVVVAEPLVGDERGEEVPVGDGRVGEAEAFHVEPAEGVRVPLGEGEVPEVHEGAGLVRERLFHASQPRRAAGPLLPSSNHHTPIFLQLVA